MINKVKWYCYVSLAIQLNISYTELNDQAVLFPTIQLSIVT